MSAPFGTARKPRYAVRVTGPAGHSRYLCTDETERLVEADEPESSRTFDDAEVAWAVAEYYQKRHQRIVCDVVNLDDAEDKCTV